MCNFAFSRHSGKKIGRINLNHKEPIVIEHLAFLSIKYNVYLSELYTALISAKETGKATCEELSIEYRGTVKCQAIFLITKASKVVVQFRVEEEFLKRKNISFESWLDTDKIRRQVNRQNLRVELTSIQNLRFGMKKVNLKAEVLETKEPHMVNTQYGNRVKVTEVWLADDSGKVKLCLWGEQIKLPVAGDIVQVKGAAVKTFKNENLLSLGRTGTYNILQPLLVDNNGNPA